MRPARADFAAACRDLRWRRVKYGAAPDEQPLDADTTSSTLGSMMCGYSRGASGRRSVRWFQLLVRTFGLTQLNAGCRRVSAKCLLPDQPCLPAQLDHLLLLLPPLCPLLPVGSIS